MLLLFCSIFRSCCAQLHDKAGSLYVNLCQTNKTNQWKKLLVSAAHHSLWSRIDATQIRHSIVPSFSTERYVRTMQTCNVTIRVSVLRPLCLSDYPKHKIKCWSKWQPSYHSVLQFSLAPVVFLYFGSLFQIEVFLCRNRFPDTMLYMAAVAKAAATSKFHFSCRPLLLSEHKMQTRTTPVRISCRGLYGAVYAVFVLLSMTTGIL